MFAIDSDSTGHDSAEVRLVDRGEIGSGTAWTRVTYRWRHVVLNQTDNTALIIVIRVTGNQSSHRQLKSSAGRRQGTSLVIDREPV